MQSVRSNRSGRSAITWSPWSVYTDITPVVEGKAKDDSGPHRAVIRLPWQDVRHLSKFTFAKTFFHL